ncbi:hypothetical protein AOLI_G00180940 [Acnodon oligacanthus]
MNSDESCYIGDQKWYSAPRGLVKNGRLLKKNVNTNTKRQAARKRIKPREDCEVARKWLQRKQCGIPSRGWRTAAENTEHYPLSTLPQNPFRRPDGRIERSREDGKRRLDCG